jgi:uncharacterized repeat protein (TIGR01451 family)
MNRLHVLIVLLAGIAAALPTGPALAGEVILPPLLSPAVIQTNGPNGLLSHGDWWSNSVGGNQPHLFNLYVPTAVPDDFMIQLELFDPECFQTNGELDERKGTSWDQTRFRLLAPDGITVIIDRTYAASALTSNQWNLFAEFTAGQFGHGIYQILVTTAGDDENTYRLKIAENDPDGISQNGDELNLAIAKASLQMQSESFTTLQVYVPPATAELRLSNFGMDSNRAIWYTSPAGDSLPGTLSGDGIWNNSTSASLPPPGGDLFTTPQSGWWTIHLIAAVNNQFTLYPATPFLMGDALTYPQLTATLQNGRTQVEKGETITYTATVRNPGTGPAQACSLTVALSPGLVVTDPGEGTLPSAQTWLWTTARLAAGEERSLTFMVFVSSETTSPVAATATLTGQDLLYQAYQSSAAIDVDQLLVAGSISGLIWQDLNHDGVKDPAEPGLPGMKIDLYGPTLTILASDTSEVNGAYHFLDLPIGTYQVRCDAAFLPEGWDATTTVQNEWLTVSDLGETFADINLGYNNFETPVELTRFTAQARPGVIELEWTTESETDNLGFNVYRSTSANGPFSRVNTALITGAGNSQSTRRYAYSDMVPAAAGAYFYKISDISYAGVETMHGMISVTAIIAPGEFTLEQNYPNPFNGSTAIVFSMKESGAVRIIIHNLLGQEVRVLVDEVREAGEHRLLWDGKDRNGITVPAGIYLYTMQVNQFRTARKLHFLR